MGQVQYTLPSAIDTLQPVVQKRKEFQRKEALHKVWPLQMANQGFDLRAGASGVLALTSLHSSSSLFPHHVWFPTRGLPLGTDCLVPAPVQTQLLLASIKVRLLQDATCAHTSSHEGR